jgi:hypothetical protein
MSGMKVGIKVGKDILKEQSISGSLQKNKISTLRRKMFRKTSK